MLFEDEYPYRWEKIQKHLEKEEADGYLISEPGNVRYLSAAHLPEFAVINTLFIPREGQPVGVIPTLESIRGEMETAVARFKKFGSHPYVDIDAKKPGDLVREFFTGGKILCDRKYPEMPDGQVESDFVRDMRAQKSRVEMQCIEQAAKVADDACEMLQEMVRPGWREVDLAAELDLFMRQYKDDDFYVSINSFHTIVATGPHAAYPHHNNTGRRLAANELVIIDYGVFVNGYASDCTRTFRTGGTLPNDLKDIFNATLESQKLGIDTVGPNITYAEIDEPIRDLIKDLGYARYFVHGTGHGIGLEVHEFPTVAAIGKETILPNVPFTIEPGIYVPGTGGARIEDDVYMDEDGQTVLLTKSPKDLI